MNKQNLLMVGFFLLFVSCRTAPIYNVTDEPVPQAPPLTMNQITDSIISAGTDLGWDVEIIESGQAVATLNIRIHMAQVNIDYTPESYSITYHDSRVLKHDGTDIHKKYNQWIMNLNEKIKSYLNKEELEDD